jgi:hypothetical protein
MDAIEPLLIEIGEAPEKFCAARTVGNYGQLLDLYERVGYGPKSMAVREKWRRETISSWSYIDSVLPGTCTVGMHRDELISSWGTIPLTSNLLYTHSVCMLKSLAGAVTLMAQALLSVNWLHRFPELSYLGTGYSYRSTFTARFQRPRNFKIPAQIETESIVCTPVRNKRMTPSSVGLLFDCKPEHETLLAENHRWLFNSFSHPFPRFRDRHSIRQLAVFNAFEEVPLALILVQDGPPFLTAADVHREILVFPVRGGASLDRICSRLRSINEFDDTALYVFLRPDESSPTRIDGETLDYSFWVATNRDQAELLRRSYVDAFTSVLQKYSQEDISDYLRNARRDCQL